LWANFEHLKKRPPRHYRGGCMWNVPEWLADIMTTLPGVKSPVVQKEVSALSTFMRRITTILSATDRIYDGSHI
jgi:hypothetical protein